MVYTRGPKEEKQHLLKQQRQKGPAKAPSHAELRKNIAKIRPVVRKGGGGGRGR